MEIDTTDFKIPREYDRRIKLTDKQREEICRKYRTGNVTQQKLADEYGVSRRLVTFILYPEKYERAKQIIKECAIRNGHTYDKAKQAAAMKRCREYKRQLFREGKITKYEDIRFGGDSK